MRHLNASPGLVSGTLVFAVAAWWLGGVALLLGGDSSDLHTLAARAAVALVLGQLLLIALVTPAAQRTRMDLLAVSLPLWPLLIVLWLTSRLSWISIVSSQVVALLLAGAMFVVALAIRSKVRSDEMRQVLCTLSGVAVAFLVWSARAPLAAWLST